VTFAREFRYDTPRARYLSIELDPAGLMQQPPFLAPLTRTWTGYDGDAAYFDFALADGLVSSTAEHEPGLWGRDAGGDAYLHGDSIGTTRYSTNSSGDPHGPRVYTAFGERVCELDGSCAGPRARFGYAGAWGYQGHDEFPFLHIGARYYDPATGRFLQRDPLGIAAGTNVYVYALGAPATRTDPSGEMVSLSGTLASMAIGAVVNGATGAAIGSVSSAGATTGGSIGVAGGIVAGVVTAVAGPVVGGASGGFVTGALNAIVTGQDWFAGGLRGAAAGVAGGLAGWAFTYLYGETVRAIAETTGSVLVTSAELYFVETPKQAYQNMKDSARQWQWLSSGVGRP
jgi:RHS repeat-associated protein